jgi:hypothetical protein
VDVDDAGIVALQFEPAAPAATPPAKEPVA